MPVVRSSQDSVSAIELLGRSLMGRRYSPEAVFSMVTCYFDESGGSDLGWTWVCGYAASVAQWERFEIDWKLFLAKYDVPYLHMKEYAHFKGPFAKWEPPHMATVRASFLRDAAEIIGSETQQAFISLISHQIFADVDSRYELRERFSSPYALSGRLCVGLANLWRSKSVSWPLDIEHIFDDGGPDKGGLMRAMTTSYPYLESPIFKPSRDFQPDPKWPMGRRGLVQLQAADYLAYEMRKFLVDHELVKQQVREVRKSLTALTVTPLSKALMTTKDLENLCAEVDIPIRGC